MSVPKFSKETGIPSARIYKWKIEGGPKVEDAEKIQSWLKGGDKLEEVPRENGQPKSLGQVPAEDLIQLLKEQNEFLRRNFELSLTGISIQAASILAHVATALEKDDEREAAGNAKKLQQLQTDTDRRIGEKMVVGAKMDMKAAGR